jgi:prophage antirepressor-like protein
MSLVKMFDYENSKVLTVIDKHSSVWFQAKTIATVLGYANPQEAIRKHVDSEDKCIRSKFEGVSKTLTLSNNEKNQVFINESGLYSLILRSKLESSRAFKKWVTSEVLPSIRKTGTYVHHENVKPNLTFKIESEFDLQSAVVNFIRTQYPDSLLTVCLGGLQDTPTKRIQSKMLGYMAGTADLIINNMHKLYNGFAIELKSPKGTGIVSPAQTAMEKRYKANGFKTLISNSYDDIIVEIIKYMNDTRIRCDLCVCKFKNSVTLDSHRRVLHRVTC